MILMGTGSSTEPALTFVSQQTLVHPLVAWKTVTILICKHPVLQWFWRLLPTVVLIPVICGLQIEWQHSKGLFFFLKATLQELIWMKFCVGFCAFFSFFSCWKCSFKSLTFSERERRKAIKTFWLDNWKQIFLAFVLRFLFLEADLALIKK